MQAGKLRHRLTLTPISRASRDTLGGVSEANGAGTSVWGSFAPVDAEERFDHSQYQVRPTHRAVIRYRAGVAHRDTVTFGGRVYDIVGIRDPSERQDGQSLELLCVARQPGAQL